MNFIKNYLQIWLKVSLILCFNLLFKCEDIFINIRNDEKSENETKGNPFWFDDIESKVCHSTRCQELGKQFQMWINKSVDPCTDFDEFVCGRFDENTIVAPDMVTASIFDKIDDKIQQNLRKQLEEPNNDYDPRSIKYASNMYKGCNDFNTLESIGVKPLIDVLNKIYNGFPVIGELAPFDSNKWNFFDVLAKAIANLSQDCIISWEVFPCFKDNTMYCLYLGSAPNLHLGYNLIDKIQNRTLHHWPSPPPMSKKPRVMKNMTRQTFIDIQIQYYSRQVAILGANVTQQTTDQIQQVIDLSTQLQQCESPTPSNPFILYQEITFQEFNAYTGIDWCEFVNKIYFYIGSHYRFKYTDRLIVYDIKYFLCLSNILLTINQRVLANFLGFCFVNDFGLYTVQAFKDLNFELLSYLYGIEKPTPLWRSCLSLVRTLLGFAISRKYVDKYFTITLKNRATELTQYISNAFCKLLDANPILDQYSRNRALKKLSTFKKNIGYPEWLFEDKTLDNIYLLDEKCLKKTFFQCITYFFERYSFKMFDSIDKPVNMTIFSWVTDPTTVNAFYFPVTNSITIPAAFISALYSCENLRYYTYGTIGFIIGHEFTHGFDKNGQLFDENGNYNTIFDETTTQLFNQKEMCFINQYNKYCDPVIDLCVNGELTIEENTADNGGFREAYLAYKMCNKDVGQPKRLPYISEYTTDQLLFISYASLWCDNIRPSFAPYLFFDVHSPSKYRTIGVLSNTQAFADAFNCPLNTPMNPTNKCILW